MDTPTRPLTWHLAGRPGATDELLSNGSRDLYSSLTASGLLINALSFLFISDLVRCIAIRIN
jgi:hypothetical protein